MYRYLAGATLAVVCLALPDPTGARQSKPSRPPFTVVEASIGDLRRAMEQGRTTSREIVRQYLSRIARYDGTLKAVVTVNPRALDEADARDRERRQRKVRGPLHGIPVALKDNINTTNMRTTGGALAFADLVPPYEATVTRQLRDAGAILIAKTSLTELANWVADDMPANYNALTGFGRNPYGPRIDPGGSSSGIGTAANLWAANVGTETSGSILNPSGQTMLVGIKPTVGRVSRYGIIPITADQDTAGPMAKFVADAAVLLGVLERTSPDPNDPATSRCPVPRGRDYTRFLDRNALKGARIGIPREFFYERPGSRRETMGEAIAVLQAQGAAVVDPVDIPSVSEPGADANLLNWEVCAGAQGARGRDSHCSAVFKYGMKRDFNRWLDSLGPAAPVRTLRALRDWNRAHEDEGAIRYGQVQLDNSDEMDLERDRARYERDRARDLELSRTRGLDVPFKTYDLDALLFPGAFGSSIAAKAGYPSIIVPYGVADVPFGVTFTGPACSEPRLIALAYAFEQATKRRVAPPLVP